MLADWQVKYGFWVMYKVVVGGIECKKSRNHEFNATRFARHCSCRFYSLIMVIQVLHSYSLELRDQKQQKSASKDHHTTGNPYILSKLV